MILTLAYSVLQVVYLEGSERGHVLQHASISSFSFDGEDYYEHMRGGEEVAVVLMTPSESRLNCMNDAAWSEGCTREQLDSVRARRPKFICINDSMMRPSEALLRTLRDFFEDLFPRSSAFELPPGTRNPSLRLDEMRAILARRRWARFAGACAAALAAAGLAARALERVW